MSDVTKSILMNKDVIAIDQDALGKQASPVKKGDLETWIKPLADGSVAVGIVNLGSSSTTASVNAADLHLSGPVSKATDLWSHQEVHFAGNGYAAQVPSHGVLMLRVWGK
jgi:alpha-galactosidase